jgi:hypothetical protein
MGEHKELRVDQIDLGPPIHETLTEQQQKRARAVYEEHWRFVEPQTHFEHFERDFLYELHPDRELAVMEMMGLTLALAKPKDNEVHETAKLILWLSSHEAVRV